MTNVLKMLIWDFGFWSRGWWWRCNNGCAVGGEIMMIVVLISMMVCERDEGGALWQNHPPADPHGQTEQKEEGDSSYFLLISFAVRDAFSSTLTWSVRERADERQRNPALLILSIQPLPLKASQPSPRLTLTPPQTGKPLLNNIIVYFILTVTSTRGEKTPDWITQACRFSIDGRLRLCVWVADFDCSLFYT